jgi:tRNA dimethylallyltransferase
MTEKIKALMIIGQTCSGKESLSLALAQHINTDIISMDSMKIYIDMNIGTAKASDEKRQKIKHHMVDIITPDKSYNVSEYIRDAIPIATKISQKNKLPLFSGGTSLYAKGLFSGLFSLPEFSSEIKKKIELEYDNDREKTYERLKLVDPIACIKIHVNDRQRVTRALEVFEVTKKPISSLQNQFKTTSDIFDFVAIGLRWPREILHERIAQRVHWMIEAGLEDEAKRIFEKYPTLGASSAKAVGYQEWIPFFNGQCTREATIERIIINTRQLCKHQMTWMKKFPIQWVDVEPTTPPLTLFTRALDIIQQSALKSYLP